jgi:plastocyanin
MKRLLAPLLACLALALVGAGCGGGDDGDGGGSSGGGGATGGGAATEVSMKGIKFQPKAVSIETGGTVRWVNDDSVGHDVTGDEFQSGEAGGMRSGDTFEHTFDTAGTFDYVCSVHPGMDGSVTVK